MTTPEGDERLLPDVTRDDTDEGWRSSDEREHDDDVRRFLDERPPHHDRF